MQVSMISCLPADDSLPFSSTDTLCIIFHDFSSHEWEMCTTKPWVWGSALSCHPSHRAWQPEPSMLGICAKSLGAVGVFGVASLWGQPSEFCDQMGHGKTVGTKASREFAPSSLGPNLSFLLCFNEFKADFRDRWMVEYVCWNKEKSLCDRKHEKLYWF